jgi:D-alanyl-D-alanine carboxypeptidase
VSTALDTLGTIGDIMADSTGDGFAQTRGSLDLEQLTGRLDHLLTRVTRRRGSLGPPQVAVVSSRQGLDYRFGDQTRRFHVASVGKTFTATLAMQLVESGTLTLGTPVTALLPADELRGLFVVDGVDLAAQVTVDHLLAHTSGVADYFEGPVQSGPTLAHLLVEQPDRRWTPGDLLDFTRERQRPIGRPGERFGYSDTGYVLVGRILEESTGQAFHDLLQEHIFSPLGLQRSALLFHSPSAPDAASVDLAPCYLGRRDVSHFRSLSCDWAGGGIVSTPGDLARFSAALHHGAVISPANLDRLSRMRHRFRPGIRYGAGLMEVRFEGFMPLLRGLPRPVGHIGILATHMFHDPVHDVDIVLNFASTREMRRSFRTLIAIEQALGRATR